MIESVAKRIPKEPEKSAFGLERKLPRIDNCRLRRLVRIKAIRTSLRSSIIGALAKPKSRFFRFFGYIIESHCLLLALFLSSCSPRSDWKFTSIPAGQKDFDSARLFYAATDNLSGINLDIYYTEGSISSYLSTAGRHICDEDQATASIQLGSETIEIVLNLHEGHMRARLPDDLAARIILSMQEEKAVTISIGSVTQTFQPEYFSTFFDKLKKQNNIFLDAFQGVLP